MEITTFQVLQALDINAKYGYTYWDSLLISTALEADCTVFYFEDLQHNQQIESKLRIINPFVTSQS